MKRIIVTLTLEVPDPVYPGFAWNQVQRSIEDFAEAHGWKLCAGSAREESLRVDLHPEGDLCTLHDCPPGYFLFQGGLCLKSEYRLDNGRLGAYCESGEVFWGGTTREKDRCALMVQPMASSGDLHV